jgi:hypothetical protein
MCKSNAIGGQRGAAGSCAATYEAWAETDDDVRVGKKVNYVSTFRISPVPHFLKSSHWLITFHKSFWNPLFQKNLLHPHSKSEYVIIILTSFSSIRWKFPNNMSVPLKSK